MISTAVAMSRTRDQSSQTFLCLKMNLPAKEMVRGAGGTQGARLNVESYLLVEVVEIIEDNDGKVEPHQCEDEDAEKEKEPAAVTLKTRDDNYAHICRAPRRWPGC